MTEYKRIIVSKRYKEVETPTESIYNLLSQTSDQKRVSKTSRYQSKHNSNTKKFYASTKKPHQTMGFTKTPLKSPAEYLKKHTRDAAAKTGGKPKVCLNKENKRPPLPERGDPPPILHEGPDKNFIRMNKMSVVRRPALRPARKAADTKNGDTFFLEFSGLVPKFSMKKEFGETPKYLVQMRKDIEYSEELYNKSFPQSIYRKLNEEERNDLLEGLRSNWELLHKRYMSLPLVIDTKVLKNRKLELETTLDSLERDIYFLEKNEENDIYVLPE